MHEIVKKHTEEVLEIFGATQLAPSPWSAPVQPLWFGGEEYRHIQIFTLPKERFRFHSRISPGGWRTFVQDSETDLYKAFGINFNFRRLSIIIMYWSCHLAGGWAHTKTQTLTKDNNSPTSQISFTKSFTFQNFGFIM